MKWQKMKFILKTKVIGFDSSGLGVKLTLEPTSGGELTILEANLELEELGVKLDKMGWMEVDHFRTSVSGIYAIDDVIPSSMIAHKAEEDGVACVELIVGKLGHLDYGVVPKILYTHPELALVGKTKEQVKALNISYAVGKFPFMANSRPITINDGEIIAENEIEKILGIHSIGSNVEQLENYAKTEEAKVELIKSVADFGARVTIVKNEQGGTFDVSVLEELSTTSNTHLGGGDFDKRIVNFDLTWRRHTLSVLEQNLEKLKFCRVSLGLVRM